MRPAVRFVVDHVSFAIFVVPSTLENAVVPPRPQLAERGAEGDTTSDGGDVKNPLAVTADCANKVVTPNHTNPIAANVMIVFFMCF